MKRLIFHFIPLLLLWQTVGAQQAPYQGGSGVYKKLVWSDEFSGNGLPDTLKWRFEKGYLRNNELQYYTAGRPENALVKDGFLHIIARNDSLQNGTEIFPITSAGLNTKGKGEWTYGRVEVRAKLPSSLGTWPAIWMLGADISKTGWPDCGEIDIMEHVGFMPDTLHFNVHTGKYNHVKHTNKGVQVPYKAPGNAFHVYAIEWFPDRIDWYFDNTKVFTYTNEKTGVAAWPFDKPQYLIVNLAFGGSWGGQRGVDLNTLPQTLSVDYVSVFQ